MSIRIVRRTRRLITLVRQAGPARLAFVVRATYLAPVLMATLERYAPLHEKLMKVRQWLGAGASLRRARRRRDEMLARGRAGVFVRLDRFGLAPAALADVRRQVRPDALAVIAEIDQDGFLLSRFGPIAGVPTVPPDAFVKRTRFALAVVTNGEWVGVRKAFGADRLSFVTELHALDALARAGCRVPPLLDIDLERHTLVMGWVPGRELRLALHEAGAVLLDRDVTKEPGYAALSRAARRAQQVERGQPHLPRVLPEGAADAIFDQLRCVHGAGFIWKDLKYGNMLLGDDGRAWLLDFDTTYDYSRTPRALFRLLCDRNIEEFNRCFGTAKLTYRRIKAQLRREGGRSGYSPAYLGYGLVSGSLLKNYVGDGRWHFIMRHHVPRLAGARLLDIGANDAFHSLQCLRHGAAEAIAIERHPEAIARGLWFREAFEWADGRRYNFRYVQADMASLPALDLGRFDFVMALCSIYYLDDGGISALIAYLSAHTDTLLLMGNTEQDIGRPDAAEYERASAGYLARALADNGFPVTRVVAPAHYSRPLVVGRTASERVS